MFNTYGLPTARFRREKRRRRRTPISHLDLFPSNRYTSAFFSAAATVLASSKAHCPGLLRHRRTDGARIASNHSHCLSSSVSRLAQPRVAVTRRREIRRSPVAAPLRRGPSVSC